MVAVLIDTPHPQSPVDGVGPRPPTLVVASPGPSRPRSRAAEVRYQRRRLVAVAGFVALLLSIVWVGQALVVAVAPAPTVGGPTVVESAVGPNQALDLGGTTIVAQPGDTLSSIARRLQPAGDIRPLVQRLSELNGGAALAVGQAVRLP